VNRLVAEIKTWCWDWMLSFWRPRVPHCLMIQFYWNTVESEDIIWRRGRASKYSPFKEFHTRNHRSETWDSRYSISSGLNVMHARQLA
jgi:hypothetical protein